MFQEKDYLDSRFFHKRAFFLANIAASIVNSSLGVDVTYDAPNGNLRRSTLVIKPKSGKKSRTNLVLYRLFIFTFSLIPGSKYDFKKLNAYIRIVPTLSADSPIPISRLSPKHANLRTADSEPSSSNPTPRYNNDILLNTTPLSHLLLLHAAGKEIPSFRDAVALLRVWANQRGYSPGGERTVVGFDKDFQGAWWSFLVLYLVWGDDPVAFEAGHEAAKKRKSGRRTIGKELSSYQMFRAVLDFLGESPCLHEFALFDALTWNRKARTISWLILYELGHRAINRCDIL